MLKNAVVELVLLVSCLTRIAILYVLVCCGVC
jgi:hypothetical protein